MADAELTQSSLDDIPRERCERCGTLCVTTVQRSVSRHGGMATRRQPFKNICLVCDMKGRPPSFQNEYMLDLRIIREEQEQGRA